MPRILYLSTKFDRPVGGVRMIFHHVRELRRLGFDASVVHTGGAEAPTWFASDAPIISGSPSLSVEPEDILVVPEVAPNILSTACTGPCRTVLFCQNQFQIFTGLRDIAGWEEAGVHFAMYCSQIAADQVGRCFSFRDAAVIRSGIDHTLFRPQQKKLCVVLMPRKRPEDVRLIRRIFERQWPQYIDYPWFSANNQPESIVAEMLSKSSIFLSLSHREGLGLPPLEAMASGCLVAGFTGQGGRDYATPDNGLWVEDDDLYGAADAVGRALEMFLERPEEAAAMSTAAQVTAARYSFDAMREDLQSFWGRILASG